MAYPDQLQLGVMYFVAVTNFLLACCKVGGASDSMQLKEACKAGFSQPCDSRECDMNWEYCSYGTCEPCEASCEKNRIGYQHDLYQDCFKLCPGYMILNNCREFFLTCPDIAPWKAGVGVLFSLLVIVVVACALLIWYIFKLKKKSRQNQITVDRLYRNNPTDDRRSGEALLPEQSGDIERDQAPNVEIVQDPNVPRPNNVDGEVPRDAVSPAPTPSLISAASDPPGGNRGTAAHSTAASLGVPGAWPQTPGEPESSPNPGTSEGGAPSEEDQQTMAKQSRIPPERPGAEQDPERLEPTVPQQPESAEYSDERTRRQKTTCSTRVVPPSGRSGYCSATPPVGMSRPT